MEAEYFEIRNRKADILCRLFSLEGTAASAMYKIQNYFSNNYIQKSGIFMKLLSAFALSLFAGCLLFASSALGQDAAAVSKDAAAAAAAAAKMETKEAQAPPAKGEEAEANDQTSEERELPIDSYELTVNGTSYNIQLGEQLRIPPVKTYKDGKNRVSVQIAPTQLAAMNTLKLRYPYPSRAFDDEGKQERTIRVYHEMGYAILITDFGGPLNNPEESVPKIVEILKNTLHEELTAKLKNPKEATTKFTDKTKNGTLVNGVIVQVKLTDDKIIESVGITLSNPDFFATMTLQLFGLPFEHVHQTIKEMLESFEKK